MSSIQLLPPSRTTAPSSPASQEQPTDHQLNPSLPKPSEEEPNVVVRDPLNWFGILVPPALRQAQGSFRLAAGDFVPKMATVVREMREVEVEVGRARKRLARLQQKKEG